MLEPHHIIRATLKILISCRNCSMLLVVLASSLENLSSGLSTGSDTNRAVQPQKIARGLKFQVSEVEGLYYPCSENKGADQLRGCREADLGLCFRICKKLVFS